MRPDTTMKYMILLYDNADMREIFSSRSDLMEEMDGLLELAGDSAAAAGAYHIASRLTTSRPERDYLLRKAAAIAG